MYQEMSLAKINEQILWIANLVKQRLYNAASNKEKPFIYIYISYDDRVFLPIARDSLKFKRLYKARTTVERLNSRPDNDYMFEDNYIRGLEKMRLMVSLSFIVMNGMAVSKVRQGIDSIRSLKRAGSLPAA
jgi:hypothetical protein